MAVAGGVAISARTARLHSATVRRTDAMANGTAAAKVVTMPTIPAASSTFVVAARPGWARPADCASAADGYSPAFLPNQAAVAAKHTQRPGPGALDGPDLRCGGFSGGDG